ncbi:MAG: DUF1499 domain-containing protein [Betaproteobacteria bacterium]|nr:DUF1499 domain-containing protein [Betaproteobacteria bacterium]
MAARPSPLSSTAWVLALLCLVVAIGDAIAGLFSGIGYRLDLWDYRDGLGALRYVFWLAAATAAVAVLAVIVGALTGRWGAVSAGGLAVLIAAITAYVPWNLRQIAQRVPAIHDISTDTVNPPRYVRVAALRKKSDHPVAYDGPEVAALQKAGYPDIAPIVLRAPAERVFEAAKSVLAGMGIKLLEADPALGRLEATETSQLFGFEDDVVVRIVAGADGTTTVDMRSKSRAGRSDLGINANRIRVFTAALRKKFA